jgi:agmatinase
VADEFVEGNFLGLPGDSVNPDIVILQVPYELTTSYGQGTAQGPAACVAASGQVELFDPVIGEDLPAGYNIYTAPEWNGEGNTLKEQLASISKYLSEWNDGKIFPIILGGEHGILPAVIDSLSDHPAIKGVYGELNVVQIDAHADLRDELDGEKFSHACAAARAMDYGLKHLYQVGIRAFSKQEYERMISDDRITTFFASETLQRDSKWQEWIDTLLAIEGPIHLTIDIDGLDGSIVPATGTPVPGGLSFWQAVRTIEAVFSAPKATVISMDVNEIVPQHETPLTQFTAAMLATKGIINHINVKKSQQNKC